MPAWLPMVLAALLFATMGVCVKMASTFHGSGEILLVRGLVGVAAVYAHARWHGVSMRTTRPGQHALRSATGVTAMALFFTAIAGLPLATAMTLNYSSSLWLSVFLAAGAALGRAQRVDRRLVVAALVGFGGVLLVLQPTMAAEQLAYGLAGLLSGLISAAGYLQVRGLAAAGEPEDRIVFYFSLASVLGGIALACGAGWRPLNAQGLAWMLAVGVLSTAGQMMLTRAYARGSTLMNASLQYLGIAFAFGWGLLLFDEPAGGAALLGVLLIVAAGVRATWLRTPAAAS